MSKQRLKITELNQPVTYAGLSDRIEKAIENAYWQFDAKKNHKEIPASERDAFKWAVRGIFINFIK